MQVTRHRAASAAVASCILARLVVKHLAWLLLVACSDRRSAPRAQAHEQEVAKPGMRIAIDHGRPDLFAVRAEGKPWQVIEPTGDHYELPDLGERFSIVLVCVTQPHIGPEIVHAQLTREDAVDLVAGCTNEERISVDVTFAPGTQFLFLGRYGTCRGDGPCELPRGVDDMFVDDGKRVKIVRDARIDGTPILADASQGFVPEPAHVTVHYPKEPRAFGTWYTAQLCFITPRGGGVCATPYGDMVDYTVEIDYSRIPRKEFRETDCYQLAINGESICLREDEREVQLRTFPNTIVTADGRGWSWSNADDADAVMFSLNEWPHNPDGSAQWHLMVTRRWLAGATHYEPPSLADVPGWKPEWTVRPEPRLRARFSWSAKPLTTDVTHKHALWARMRTGDRNAWLTADVVTPRDTSRTP
jgi:hypothetical protein